MDLNTGMMKSYFIVIALAAILSLSSVANAFAVSNDDNNNGNDKNKKSDERDKPTTTTKEVVGKAPGTGPHKPECCINGKKFKSLEGGGAIILDGDNGNHHRHDDGSTRVNHQHNSNNNIDRINSLFRSDGNTGSASAATATPQGFNATFFDASTPYCWYVVNAPPCFDMKTGTIIH